MKWALPPVENNLVQTLSDSFNLDTVMAAVLACRNITAPEKIAFFIEEDERFLHNPFLFPDMEKAVARVTMAAREGEKVLVFGDRDTDGITATVLMVETLRMAGIKPEWRVPLGGEDYGLNEGVIKEYADDGFTLLITVDCGITDFEPIEFANQAGMDVLVFDHHVPRENRYPNAWAMVNPKIPGSYPFEGLCAAAVVSKFQWAMCWAGTDPEEQTDCLILARRRENEDGQHEIIIEALLMRRLIEIDRIEISSLEGQSGQERLLRFIEGFPLLTYGVVEQKPLISEFFGGADVFVRDAAEEISRSFPVLRGRSLKDLKKESRMARYYPESRGMLATLKNLVVTLKSRNASEALGPWRRGLDLVAIGTLADRMPLTDENRILVRMGLSRMDMRDGISERRGALRELLVRKKLHSRRVGSTEVSWQICPLVNSTGRMDRADAGVSFFLSDNNEEITRLADRMISLNSKRRTLSEKFWDRIQPMAYESLKNLEGRMAIVSCKDLPRGITGILANRLQKTVGVPSVVISETKTLFSGSIRCEKGFNVLHWMKSVSSLMDDFGGHPQAGGFRFTGNKVEELNRLTGKWLSSAEGKSPANGRKDGGISIDIELSHEEISRLGPKGIERFLEKLEPYGEGFRPLVFLTRSVMVHQAEFIGKPKNNHLKLLVSLGKNKWPALWWDGAENYDVIIKPGTNVDMIYQMDPDPWRGAEARRLTVMEAKPCV